jgi:hypothetical protein
MGNYIGDWAVGGGKCACFLIRVVKKRYQGSTATVVKNMYVLNEQEFYLLLASSSSCNFFLSSIAFAIH